MVGCASGRWVGGLSGGPAGPVALRRPGVLRVRQVRLRRHPPDRLGVPANVTRRRAPRAYVPVVLSFLLLVGACGGEDKGDIVAFCELAEDGVGMRPAEGEGELAQVDALEDAAPPDIREAVTTVANASREIDEIEDLEELFERAFALEEAVATARQEIRTYTQHYCL